MLPPAASIFSRAVALQPCTLTVSFLLRSPLPRILTGMLAGREAGCLEARGRDLGAVVEALLEAREVDRLRMRPELLEGHRHLLVRAAQLAHPHVDRVLPALMADVAFRARAGALALVATAGSLAHARAGAATDALAVLAGARLRAQVLEADVGRFDASHQEDSSTTTRCSTLRSSPRRCTSSVRLVSFPIRPSRRVRRVSR